MKCIQRTKGLKASTRWGNYQQPSIDDWVKKHQLHYRHFPCFHILKQHPQPYFRQHQPKPQQPPTNMKTIDFSTLNLKQYLEENSQPQHSYHHVPSASTLPIAPQHTFIYPPFGFSFSHYSSVPSHCIIHHTTPATTTEIATDFFMTTHS